MFNCVPKKEVPVWLSADDVSRLINLNVQTVKEKCRNAEFSFMLQAQGNKNEYYISFKSLPKTVQDSFLKKDLFSKNDKSYADAPAWAKKKADKYIDILKATVNLRGEALKKYIEIWNADNPDYKTSYTSINRMRRKYTADGIKGLLAKYGTNSTKSTVPDEYFDYFKNLYLKEGAPSLRSCWDLTLGFAMRQSKYINSETFPSYASFKRKLKRLVPKQSIYMARYGDTAWNRKYGGYLERDYSNITCGKVWVSDHAQIDVACLTPDGDIAFPWVTAWRDYKSGKWLGWYIQCGNPNSDHIFQTFYYAAEKYGLPEDVIIDNGKDYRCKDFAGGRRKENIKISCNKSRTTSMLDELNVNVHFALPYNAQTKPIERDFNKMKEILSKHCIGYRGGNVVERPEKLAEEIKKGKIIPFDKFKALFDSYIAEVLNKKPSQGKNHNGICPDELFNREFQEKVTPSNNALKLFCMRTSRNYTVHRNGIKDRELGITYWADWMISKTGLKVYLRRDPSDYKMAWAFRADNEEFVGTIKAVKAVAALHADSVSKEEFKEAMAIKKRNYKVTKSYIKQTREISLEEQYENYKMAYSKTIKEANPRVSKIANTNMDKAIRKNKEMEALGQQDLSMLCDFTPVQEEPLYLYETDRILDEELKGVVNGY